MRDPAPRPILLKDYSPPPFRIPRVALDVDVRDGEVLVRSTLALERNAEGGRADAPLVLDGEQLEIVSIAIDGAALDASAYSFDSEHLTIAKVDVENNLLMIKGAVPGANGSLVVVKKSK